MSTCLIIFAKSPIPGKVKTRLTPHITPTKAAELYEAFIADTISTALRLKCERTIVAYSPGYAEKTFQRLCGQSVDYLPQKGHNLSEKMKNAFKHSFGKGFKRTVIIGTDSPTLPLSYIRKAFDVLKRGFCYNRSYFSMEAIILSDSQYRKMRSLIISNGVPQAYSARPLQE